MKTFKNFTEFGQAYKANLKESASGFDKDVHPDYYEKYPEYTGGGWFTDVHKFNDYLMDPTSYYHKRAVRSPQHPVNGRKELRFRMKDNRMKEPAFKRAYSRAIKKPMDRELIAIVKTAKNKGKA